MIDRRAFLRAVGIAAAGAIAVPQVRLILPEAPMLPREHWFGRVRELRVNELKSGGIIVRHDVRAGDIVLGIDGSFRDEDHFHSTITAHRALVAEVLALELQHRGYSLEDIEPLPEWA